MRKVLRREESPNYLEYNLQRKASLNILEKLVVGLIKKKYNVSEHYALYLRYFIEVLGLNNKRISVCEIGGGDGRVLSYNNKNIIEKVMIDCDPYYKERLEKQKIIFIQKYLGKGQLKIRNRFDIVILNHVIEHVVDYQIATSEIYNMLKPDGFTVVRCPNIRINRFGFWDDPTHMKPYTPKSLESVFRMSGFETLLVRKFSYNGFIFGFRLGKDLQNLTSRLRANEILYIGRKPCVGY